MKDKENQESEENQEFEFGGLGGFSIFNDSYPLFMAYDLTRNLPEEPLPAEEKKEKPKAVVKNRPKVQFYIGDHVRLYDGKAVGTIDSLEKNKAFVNYGTFTTQVHTDELELVKRS